MSTPSIGRPSSGISIAFRSGSGLAEKAASLVGVRWHDQLFSLAPQQQAATHCCPEPVGYPDTRVVFVDRATQTIRTLAESLGRSSGLAGRYRLVCADVLHMELPAAPVNFVIAGVSNVVIYRFL